MHGIRDNYEVRVVNDPVSAASNTDDNSTRIDTAGYESVMFVVPITDSFDTGVATLKVEENDVDSDAGMAAVSGAAASATSGANDDLNGTALVAEYRLPAKRYVQAVITSATANIAFGSTIAILKPMRVPAEQGATVSDDTYVSN